MNSWTLDNKPFLEHPSEARAFIYKITYIATGQYYIGYKLFKAKSTKKLGKKAIATMIDKRKSKKIVQIKESLWKNYVGSCKNSVYKDLWNKDPFGFKREVLYIVNNGDWSEKYYEKKYMVLLDWENTLCFNENFEGKYFLKKNQTNSQLN